MSKNRKYFGGIIFWISYPGIFFILRNSHRTRVIINSDEKILFVRTWLGGKKLGLPGGGIKIGENSKQAAVRELKEETGLSVRPTDLKLVGSQIVLKERGIKYFGDCYYIRLPKSLPTQSKHLEIIESVWLNWKPILDTNQLSKITNKLLHAWLAM